METHHSPRARARTGGSVGKDLPRRPPAFCCWGALTLGKAHERGCDLSPASDRLGRPNQGINHGFPTSFAASRTRCEFPPPAAVWEHGKIYRPSPGRQLEASFPMAGGLQPPAAPGAGGCGLGTLPPRQLPLPTCARGGSMQHAQGRGVPKLPMSSPLLPKGCKVSPGAGESQRKVIYRLT